MSDLSSSLIHFDLPPLDDSNSILLTSEKDSADKKDSEKHTVKIELLHGVQSFRMPLDLMFEEHFFSEKIVSDDTNKTVPIFSVVQKKIVKNQELQPKICFMPTANFSIDQDQPVPVYFIPHQKIAPETTNCWKSALLKSNVIPIHDCAVEFHCLFDVTHQGFIKSDLVTKEAPKIENCVLTSTDDSLSSLSMEAAMMENPLLNALAVAAVSNCWFELSPTILLQIIDQTVYRFVNSQKEKLAEKAKSFANFCVEDTTAAVESISAQDFSKKKSSSVHYWNNSEFYYDCFSTQVAQALNQQFVEKDFSKFPQDEKTRFATLKVALCAQNSTRIVSTYDSAKGIYACEKTFIHPTVKLEPSENSNTNASTSENCGVKKNSIDSSSKFKEIIADFCANSLNCQDDKFIKSSTTLAENCKTNCALFEERRREAVKIESNETLTLHENVFQANKFIFSGHYQEWRALIQRLKKQIQHAPQDLKTWLSAMFWLVLQICNEKTDYKHPEGIYTSDYLDPKDKQFLKIAVGKEFAELDKNFLTKFFWFDPTENLVGGLALLFFPFEAELFLSIANSDSSTNRLFPYKNGALMRVHGHLLSHGIATSEIYDIRTTCQYDIHSSHIQIRRRIINGFSGFNCVKLHLGAKDEFEPILIRAVVTAFDVVDCVLERHLLQVLPEVNSKIENQFVIDRSLERFALFPTLAYDKGVFMMAIDETTSKGNAGFNDPKVANAFKAASFDQTTIPTIFDAHLKNYKQKKKNSFLSAKQQQQKQVASVSTLDALQKDVVASVAVTVIIDSVHEEKNIVLDKPSVASIAEKKSIESKNSLENDKIAAKKQEKLLLAQEKRRQHLLLQQKKDEQKKQENIAQKKEKEKKMEKMSQIDRDAALAKKLQNLETTYTEDLQEFTPVVGKGKKKNLVKNSAATFSGNVKKMQTPFVSTDQSKTIASAESSTVQTLQPISIAKSSLVESPIVQPIAVALAQPIAVATAQPIAVAKDEPIAFVVANDLEKIADKKTLFDAKLESKNVAVVEHQPVDIIEKEPVAVAIVESQPAAVSIESIAASKPIDELPVVAESLTVAAEPIVNASFYQIPAQQTVDLTSLNRFVQSMRSSMQHVRYWLDLATCDRAFSHEKHVLWQNRLPYNIDQARTHFCPCTDGTMHVYSTWSILSTAFDEMVEKTQPNKSLMTLILNGCQNSIRDSRMQMLSKIGKLIFDSVLNMAAYSLAETRKNSACSTCYLCRIAAPTRFAFIPQYIDANHTMVTRMMPMCEDERCSSLLLQKVSDRSQGDAKFPGLRVFFHFDNSVSICESENDLYKYTINQSFVKPPMAQRFSNADFATQEDAIILRDQKGHVFALPQAVAQKAYLLAQYLMEDVETPKN